MIETAERSISAIEEHGFLSFRPMGTIHRGWARAQLGQVGEGISEIEDGIAAWRSTGVRAADRLFDVILADAYLLDGRFSDVLALTEKALCRVEEIGEREMESVVLYTRGDAYSALSAVDEAEACYANALKVARSQSAKSWELRAATRLARLWHSQDKTTEARDLLAPVYGWFTEGFDTADLKEAKALLEEPS